MRFSLIISILITLFIWVNSMLPGSISSAQSGFIVGLADDILSFIGINIQDETLVLLIRKTAHFVEFFFLGISLSVYMLKERYKISHVLWIGLSVAIIDETIQLFVSGRAASFVDVIIDFAGVSCAVMLMYTLRILNNRKNKDDIAI